MQYLQRAKIIKPQQLDILRYSLPKSWRDAVGILKGENIDPLRYQKKIREDWEARLKKQAKLSRVKHYAH